MVGRTLYIDCFSGIAGDMFLGALFDLAEQLGFAEKVNPTRLKESLRYCPLPSWSIELKPCKKQGLEGKLLRVLTPWGEERVEDIIDHVNQPALDQYDQSHEHDHIHSHEYDHSHSHEHDYSHGLSFVEIKDLLTNSELSELTINRALRVFEIIAQAESRAHGVPIEKVYFHEVGMLDSIIDVLGVSWCLEQLNITRIISAPPPINRGWVRCAHGILPLPTPATAFILEGIETCTSPHQVELITPTGAAMIKALSDELTQSLPSDPVEAIGLGAGKRDLKDRPNLLRLFVYAAHQSNKVNESSIVDSPSSSCWLYESNIDDMRAEDLAVLSELLFKVGALDVWQTAIMMKKNRLACLLSVLCNETEAKDIEEAILFHSTSIGCRRQRVERKVLKRRFLHLDTQWGLCRIKVSRLQVNDQRVAKEIWRYKPELEDLKILALQSGYNLETIRAKVYILLNEQSYSETEDFWLNLQVEK